MVLTTQFKFKCFGRVKKDRIKKLAFLLLLLFAVFLFHGGIVQETFGW